MNRPTITKTVLPILVAVALVAALSIVVDITYNDAQTVTVTVQSPAGPTTVTTTETALDEVKLGSADDHADLRQPADTCEAITDLFGARSCVPKPTLKSGLAQQKQLAAADPLPDFMPLAAPTVPGCRSKFVVNSSSRGGVRPILFVLHITVSKDNGWVGVNAITAYFNIRSVEASSTFVVSGDGHCNYIVPMTLKPWTQATFNPVSISAEITATQTQGYLVKAGGKARLAKLIAHVRRVWKIPMRAGATRDCKVIRSGVVDHSQLGACGGGHVDVNPYRGEIPGIIRAARVYYRKRYGDPVARRCSELREIRRRAARTGWTLERRVRARQLKQSLGSARAATCR